MTTNNNQPPFSETALDFTSDNAKVTLADSESWVFRHEDFTIESWVYCTDLSESGDYLNDKTIFGSMTSRNKLQFLFYIRHSGELGFWNGRDSVGGGKLENDTWHHVALVRRNLRIYMYVDGKLVYTGCHVFDYRQNGGFSIGAAYDPWLSSSPGWSRYFKGYMQDFRVTKGHAVYTSDFVLAKSLLNKCPAEDRCQEQCPRISWQVKDAHGQWIDRSYPASEFLTETSSTQHCTSDWTRAHLCADVNFSNNWNLSTSSHFRNLKYTDCDGNITDGTWLEFRKITEPCGGVANSRHLEFKACFITSTPTPLAEPTPTPTETSVGGGGGTPSTISPRPMSFDEVIAVNQDSGSADDMMSFCNLTLYVKDGKYHIASGVNVLGEPETFFPSPTIEIDCNCFPTTGGYVNQSVAIGYTTEVDANESCVNQSIFDEVSWQTYELCTRPFSWGSQATAQLTQEHPIALSETPDGTWNGGTKLESNVGEIKYNSNMGVNVLGFNPLEITEPTTLYYYCENHPNMGGQINITPCVPTPTPTPTLTPCNPTENQYILALNDNGTLPSYGGDGSLTTESDAFCPGTKSIIADATCSGLTVTYSSSDENVVSVGPSVEVQDLCQTYDITCCPTYAPTLNPVGVGTATITASQPGDCTYLPAPEKTFTVTVSLAPTPTPTPQPPSGELCDKTYHSKADFPQYITISGVLNDDVVIDGTSYGNNWNGDYYLVFDPEVGGCDIGEPGIPRYVKVDDPELSITGRECWHNEDRFGYDGNGFVLYPWENGNDPDANWDSGWFFEIGGGVSGYDSTGHATFCPNILSGIGWHYEGPEQNIKYPNWVIEETSPTPTPTNPDITPTPTPTSTPMQVVTMSRQFNQNFPNFPLGHVPESNTSYDHWDGTPAPRWLNVGDPEFDPAVIIFAASDLQGNDPDAEYVVPPGSPIESMLIQSGFTVTTDSTLVPIFSSSDENIVSVNGTKLNPVGAGIATITISSATTDKFIGAEEKTFTVMVSQSIPQYIVAADGSDTLPNLTYETSPHPSFDPGAKSVTESGELTGNAVYYSGSSMLLDSTSHAGNDSEGDTNQLAGYTKIKIPENTTSEPIIHTVTVSHPGDTTYAPASKTFTIIVNPTPTPTPTPVPPFFLCPVSQVQVYDVEVFFLKADKELWIYAGDTDGGNLGFVTSRLEHRKLDDNVDEFKIGGQAVVYRKGTDLYAAGTERNGSWGIGTTDRDPDTILGSPPVQIASNVKSFSVGGGIIAYVTNDDKAFVAGGEYVTSENDAATWGQNWFNFPVTNTYGEHDSHMQNTFIQVAENVDQIDVRSLHHTLVLFNDGELKYKGAIRSESWVGDETNEQANIKTEWTSIASDVIFASSADFAYAKPSRAGGSGSGLIYITSDNKLWGSGFNSFGQLGVQPTWTDHVAQSDHPDLYMKREIAENVIAASAKTNYTLHYITSDNKLYGLGQDYYGLLGSGLNQTANPHTNSYVPNIPNYNGGHFMWQPSLIDENVTWMDDDGWLWYGKSDGSTYVAGSPHEYWSIPAYDSLYELMTSGQYTSEQHENTKYHWWPQKLCGMLTPMQCETCDTDMSTISGLSTWSSVQGIADTTTGQEIPTFSGSWEWPWQKSHPHLNIPYDHSADEYVNYYTYPSPAGGQAFISGDGSTVMLSHPATDDSNLTNAGVIQLWKRENNLWNLSTHLMGTQGNAAELSWTRDGYMVRNYFGGLTAMDTSGKIVITELGDTTTDNLGSTYQIGSYVYDESADTWTASQSVTISAVNALVYDQVGVDYGPVSRLTSNSCCTRFACSWLTKIGDQRYVDINICDRTDHQNGQTSWTSTAQFSIDINRDITDIHGDPWNEAEVGDLDQFTYNYMMKMSGDGNTLVVSEHSGGMTHDDAETRTRVYRKATSSNTWSQIGSTLVTSSPMDNFGFDADVSSDGNTIIVGAPGGYEAYYGSLNQNVDRGTHGNRRGFARVYKYNSSNWELDGEFVDPDTELQSGIRDEFATAVAVNCSGDMIAISDTAEQKFMIYRRESGSWTLHSELVPDWSQSDGSYAQMFYPDQVSFSEDGTHVILKLGYATTASEYNRQIRVLKLT